MKSNFHGFYTVFNTHFSSFVFYNCFCKSTQFFTNGVAFGLMAGVEVNLTDNLSADIGYRYRQIFSEDAYDNEALIGLRYSF